MFLVIRMPKTRFIKVRCPECSSEQVVFDTPSTVVKCLVCNTVLIEPTGGRGNIKGKVVKVLE